MGFRHLLYNIQKEKHKAYIIISGEDAPQKELQTLRK